MIRGFGHIIFTLSFMSNPNFKQGDQEEAQQKSSNFITDSGIPIARVYPPLPPDFEQPGEFPFTRGIHPSMYRSKLWTMRQYSGFSTAEESNRRYHYLLSQGTTGLSVAFDLPTQIGYDSDHAMAEGEVGKVGVAICSQHDMAALFKGISLQQVTTSMTINATAFILLAMYVVEAQKQGADLKKISGTIQNDILKEYAARGTYIYPPRSSMRIITDIFAWCSRELPRWNSISISGYHIREAGSTAAQELAFTLANGKAYLLAAQTAGLNINTFGKRLSFFFNAHNHFFEEIAKFRAARRIWAKITQSMGATDADAQKLRFHTQTGGSTLTAQQPHNNITRVTLQALAAVLGGTQSLHTNGFDEALSLPTEEAARIALRTQQIIAYETGVTQTVDPFAGSYFIETLTNELEAAAWAYIDKIDAMGGSVAAIEQGYLQDEIANAAYKWQQQVEEGEKIVVGVNQFTMNEPPPANIFRIDDSIRKIQSERLAQIKANRNAANAKNAIDTVIQAAKNDTNLMPPVIAAIQNDCTLGEIADALRGVFGEF
jgi:methylmalonyl-CoA mutase N-terminal domain/subunit